MILTPSQNWFATTQSIPAMTSDVQPEPSITRTATMPASGAIPRGLRVPRPVMMPAICVP